MMQNVGLQKDNTSRKCVDEIWMLCWICGHTKRDRIRNDIWEKLGVAPIQTQEEAKSWPRPTCEEKNKNKIDEMKYT
jgi:hypothetical protein